MYDEDRNAQRKATLKFLFVASAVAVGSYYGVGRYIVRSNKNTKLLAKQVGALGEYLIVKDQAHDAFVETQKAAITHFHKIGVGYTFFPGLGVMQNGAGGVLDSIKD